MGPLANGALCLSTPKHNGKSGTEDMQDAINCLHCLTIFLYENNLIKYDIILDGLNVNFLIHIIYGNTGLYLY